MRPSNSTYVVLLSCLQDIEPITRERFRSGSPVFSLSVPHIGAMHEVVQDRTAGQGAFRG
jgi:hypothetical protein